METEPCNQWLFVHLCLSLLIGLFIFTNIRSIFAAFWKSFVTALKSFIILLAGWLKKFTWKI
jgi:hypothetical protein